MGFGLGWDAGTRATPPHLFEPNVLVWGWLSQSSCPDRPAPRCIRLHPGPPRLWARAWPRASHRALPSLRCVRGSGVQDCFLEAGAPLPRGGVRAWLWFSLVGLGSGTCRLHPPPRPLSHRCYPRTLRFTRARAAWPGLGLGGGILPPCEREATWRSPQGHGGREGVEAAVCCLSPAPGPCRLTLVCSVRQEAGMPSGTGRGARGGGQQPWLPGGCWGCRRSCRAFLPRPRPLLPSQGVLTASRAEQRRGRRVGPSRSPGRRLLCRAVGRPWGGCPGSSPRPAGSPPGVRDACSCPFTPHSPSRPPSPPSPRGRSVLRGLHRACFCSCSVPRVPLASCCLPSLLGTACCDQLRAVLSRPPPSPPESLSFVLSCARGCRHRLWC